LSNEDRNATKQLATSPRRISGKVMRRNVYPAYGLPRDEALKSVTLSPAQLLGVADRFGSLEAGKVANVIVTTAIRSSCGRTCAASSSPASRSAS